MKLECDRATFDAYCEAASRYWATNTLPGGEAVILVEALHPQFRVTLRNLTIASALRRLMPARIVMLTGTDHWWIDAVWQSFDVELYRRLGTAYGAEVIDIHELVDGHLDADEPLLPPGLAGVGEGASELAPMRPDELRANFDATFCRLQWIPRVTEDDRAGPEYVGLRRRGEAFAELYRQLLSRLRPVAFVTSHVDYNHWGLGATAAADAGIPVLYVQQNGGLKAYSVFPEQRTSGRPLRADLTQAIGDVFERQVWPMRESLRTSADLVAWRSKGNLGRPIWWRGGTGAAAEILNPVQRAQVRRIAMGRLGFDPGKPVVVVFNHAISDAIGGNIEQFADLADWFEQTVEMAARETSVNWLLLDHPSQVIYDRTGYIHAVEQRHAGITHMRFLGSLNLSKNLLWSLADLGVTVRGSVSNELPAYGIPVLQAGWSEWSACGLSQVATDRADYWRILQQDIRLLVAGTPVITPEQIQRARLWLWFYRAATDLVTPLVPHWSEGADDAAMRLLTTRLQEVESDGDALFTAMHRMWTRREPVLSRFDLSSRDAYEAAAIVGRDARG